MLNKLSLSQITTLEAFYIIKAIKVRYNIKVTELIKSSFPSFYGGLNKNVGCDEETIKTLSNIINSLGLDIVYLIENGRRIVYEEKEFKKINWSLSITKIKEILNLKNRDLSNRIGVDISRLQDWEKGTRTPNYKNCKLILFFLSNTGVKFKDVLIYNKDCYNNKTSYKNTIIKINDELSEFIGILNGDGTITKGGLIAITGDKNEDYLHHKIRLNYLNRSLYNLHINQRIRENVIISSFSSMKFTKELNYLGLPLGKKINLKIPKKIIRNNRILKSYLRGLFDTDGTICRRNKNNIRIAYGSFKETNFASQINGALKRLNLNSSLKIEKETNKGSACISNDLGVINFFMNIGSANPTKIARFVYWQLKGYCPSDNYEYFRLKLKEEFNINIENFGLPFIWNVKYINSLENNTKYLLREKLKENYLMFKSCYLKDKINWNLLIKHFKDRFKIRDITRELKCNYKTLWQWENNKRKPNLKFGVKLIKFCYKNKINLREPSFLIL